jgi:hypothetical protein
MQARSHGAVSAAISTTPETNVSGDPWRVAIVGAGFSGTTLAIHLLKEAASAASPRNLRIALIDPRSEIGAGVAYATRDYPYPLNVAAGQMSVDSARPGDFLDYLKSQGIHAAAGDYLPRQVYGDYLRARFAEARAAAPPNVEFVHHRASAWQLRRNDDRWLLWLDDGTPLPADDVVLAFGNPPPATAVRARASGAQRSIHQRSVEHRHIRESGGHWQRAARRQWPHDGRRGPAARGPASARQEHSRAVTPRVDTRSPGFGVVARHQARCRPAHWRRHAARPGVSCVPFVS